MKIALFDDHQFVINALSDFLKQKEGVEIVGAATTKQEILDLLERTEVDILISDVLTDEEIGLSLLEEVQKKKFTGKVVVYSSINSEFVKGFLLNYGVVAIVHKKEPLEQLWEALKLVYLDSSRKKNTTHPPRLSEKEKEIVRYLSKGLGAKEVAVLTGNSVNTINNQKNHLLEKFNCSNSVELVLKVQQMGYLKM